ncbi:MAG: prephenate dehydrogenase [Clostridia bacterium]|nr:prephenate dehydrogenase [Clostridia bacterium]
MKLNKNQDTKILIVGLGLIGGSYAIALKKKGYTVSAITKEDSSVQYALEHGIVDYATTNVEEALVREADLVIFALYPHVFLEWIKSYQHLFRPGTVITDVTGVKSCIVYDIQNILRKDVEFISAHPMAGRESSGVENSTDKIFENANYIVVPTDKNTPEAIELCKELGWILGFRRVTQLSPEEHDKMIGFLSQLTHCIAVSLMCTNDDPLLCEYTGDSFRDLTRIAKINENMWSELFMLNQNILLEQMDAFIAEIGKFRSLLANGDAEGMREMMRCSTERRIQFDKK